MAEQLIYKTNEDCDLTFQYFYTSSRFGERNFSGIPLIMYSNNTICWEVTDYLLHRYHQNQNIAKNTLNTYARHLSRVVSFLDHNRLSFEELTDDNLFELVNYLQNPKYSKNGHAADNNQVNKILDRFFHLLIFLKDSARIPQKKISTNIDKIGDINLIQHTFKLHRSNIRQTCLLYTSPSPRDRG